MKGGRRCSIHRPRDMNVVRWSEIIRAHSYLAQSNNNIKIEAISKQIGALFVELVYR